MHSSACFHVFFRPGILSQRAGSHHQKVATLTNCSLSVLTDQMKDSGSWPSFSSSLCSRSLHLPKKSLMKKRHRNKNNGCSLCRAGMASHKVNRHGSHPKRSLELSTCTSLKWMHFATKDAPELSYPISFLFW